ncbi:MAG: AraC family transcriptional regulator [Alphaproteobacteria bacterium]|nr:AraC family transcriptional regulator [Alphaproteobacteria bacterium]
MPQPTRIITTKPLLLAGRNRTYKLGPDTRSNMKELWVAFMEDFGKIEGQVGFAAYGVCHSTNANKAVSGETVLMDYMAAVEVKDQGQVPGYFTTPTIPARKTAVFLHEGDIAGLPKTWEQIFEDWLPAAKLEVAQGPQFEVYGEDFNAGDDKIEIYIPVK